MLLSLLLVVCPLLQVSLTSAVPGSTWTEEEALVVKAKLHALLDSRGKASTANSILT